ncbi:MAG TPA: glycosyltransferase, partial [Candidatus Atribacteria bacterium]|nr:glycosyltransferase [Candidatus Atribacteria bacterium]
DLDTLQVGVWLKKKLGIKLIYDAHEIFGYMISRSMPKFIINISFKFEKVLIRYVDHVITVNEPLKTFFSKMVSRPIEIVMNCGELVNDKYVPPNNNIFTLGYFGVLDRSRKFPDIIDIIGEIKNIRFVIAGKRENLYQEVKRKCEKYSNIIFLGSIPYSEAIRRTFECDAIICLMDPKDKNSQVGLPNKVFEGMLAGRPILVSKNLYYSKLVEKEKCGLTVEYESDEAIKDSIIKLRDNSALCRKLGENGLKAAVREYNWKKQEKKLIGVYEGLM